jgi:hypothetical protein
MNTLEKINKAKYETAEQILEKIFELNEKANMDELEDLIEDIQTYIRKEYLFKSDYTK